MINNYDIEDLQQVYVISGVLTTEIPGPTFTNMV